MPDGISRSIDQDFAAGKWLNGFSLVTGAVPNHWMSNWLNADINRHSSQGCFICGPEWGSTSSAVLHVFVHKIQSDLLNVCCIDDLWYIMFPSIERYFLHNRSKQVLENIWLFGSSTCPLLILIAYEHLLCFSDLHLCLIWKGISN